MQKHRSKRERDKRRMANANYRLSVAAAKTVIGSLDPLDGRENVALAYLREEFVSKYCDETLTPASVRRESAIRKFMECEQVNAETNLRFKNMDMGYQLVPRVPMSRFLRFARRLIRDILGPIRDELVLGSFSGGASTSRRRTLSNPARKFDGKADVTEEAVKYLDVLFHNAPLLREYGIFNDVKLVEGNILFTVPKKTDIDRCACKEPDINMFLQKGVGAHLRRRLRRFGIDLNDQSRNRHLAYLGSLDNSLATLDLSSASDRISIEVVRTLLPSDWFAYLDDIRSKSVLVDGKNHRMEMFSSMGNGFTFELESLIFFALMRSTAYFEGISGVISVYGDDIIIPSGMYDQARFVLQTFGFLVNDDKSFATGPFRESCGGHYHNGIDITPFYVKRLPTRLTDVIRVANQLRRWAMADPWRRYEIVGLFQAWKRLADLVPRRFWGGYDYSLDTQLVAPVPSSHVLQRVRSVEVLPAKGSYMLWHNSNWSRAHQGIDPGVEPASTTQICRSRRAKPGMPATSDYFYEELVGYTGSAG